MSKLANNPDNSGAGNRIKSETGTVRAVKKAKNRLSFVEAEPETLVRIDALAANDNNRPLQTRAYEDFARSIREGRRSGIFKLPTGTGKTRVFSNILHSLGRNGLILIPRTPLYKSTRRDLFEAGFNENEIKFPHEEDGDNAEDRFMSLLTDPNIDWQSGRIQCIMTYQSLVSMVRKNPLMAEFIRSHFGVIIEDEAHRGLGEQTRAATGAIDRADEIGTDEEMDADELAEFKAELEAEKILSTRSDLFHYYFTATPDLIDKSIAESEEYITFATVEEAIRTGAIVLPQFVDVGEAYIRETTEEAEVDKWKSGDIDRYSEDDAFVDEHGISIREKIISAYKEKLALHGKLPGVAFASTTDHAEQIVADMRKAGIRATRVTSAPGDLSPDEATALMDDDKLDVIVTVMKVAEGFDYPPLSCAMWFAPSLSSAKILQGNGRIMRITDDKLPEDTVGPDGRLIPSPNTYIIGPSAWHAGYPNSESGGSGMGHAEGLERGDTKASTGRLGNFYELLIRNGELDIDSIPVNIRDIVSLPESILCEPGQEVKIDGIVYVGVNNTNETMGIKGKTILRNAEKSGIAIIQVKKEDGKSVQLVPKDFIESLTVEYVCEIGEEIEIDGVVYVGANNSHDIMGVKGNTLLNKVKKENIPTIPARQSNGQSIQLVPKVFIESLVVEHICEPGQEIEVNGVLYLGVTRTNNIFNGVLGLTIMRNVSKANIPIISARQTNGCSIKLIPKSFIESLVIEHICEPGQEIEVNGVVCIGVNNGNGVMGLKGSSILNSAKKSNIAVTQAKQENGKSVQLVPKSFIESLVVEHLCEPGQEIEVNGIVYVGVTQKNKVMGMQGQTIFNNATKSGILIISGRQANKQLVRLVPKSFIESLVSEYNCELGHEIEIGGVVYIGVTKRIEVMGVKGQAIIVNAKKAGIALMRARQSTGSSIQLVPKSFVEELAKRLKSS